MSAVLPHVLVTCLLCVARMIKSLCDSDECETRAVGLACACAAALMFMCWRAQPRSTVAVRMYLHLSSYPAFAIACITMLGSRSWAWFAVYVAVAIAQLEMQGGLVARCAVDVQLAVAVHVVFYCIMTGSHAEDLALRAPPEYLFQASTQSLVLSTHLPVLCRNCIGITDSLLCLSSWPDGHAQNVRVHCRSTVFHIYGERTQCDESVAREGPWDLRGCIHSFWVQSRAQPVRHTVVVPRVDRGWPSRRIVVAVPPQLSCPRQSTHAMLTNDRGRQCEMRAGFIAPTLRKRDVAGPVVFAPYRTHRADYAPNAFFCESPLDETEFKRETRVCFGLNEANDPDFSAQISHDHLWRLMRQHASFLFMLGIIQGLYWSMSHPHGHRVVHEWIVVDEDEVDSEDEQDIDEKREALLPKDAQEPEDEAPPYAALV